MDNHGIHITDIQTGFNNGGRYQHVDFSVDKIVHDPFQFLLLHLSVRKRHRSFRNQLLNPCGDIGNIVDAVVYIIYLAAPGKLPDNGFSHHFFVVFHNIGLDRKPVSGRLFQYAHIPDSNQAHMERPGYGSSRQRQYVHILF